MNPSTLPLDRSNRDGLYRQVVGQLAAAISSGDLPIGSRLPSERRLAADLGVSRTTVVTAYRELEARGLVRGQVGRGTFVVGDDGAADDDVPFAWRGKLAAGARRSLDPSLRALIQHGGPGTISFAPGQPALDRFPMADVRRISDEVLRRGAARSVGLLPSEGDPDLRAAIAARAGADPRQILVTAGAQQGLDLVSRCLIDPGDVVVMDRPGYLGAIGTFLAAGAAIAGWDIERADLDELEALLVRYAPKLIYVNPTYQNPTGRTLPVARRQALLDLARRHRVPVVEDEPYRELGFPGTTPPPTLRELDRHGVVIHLGTVSKVLAAGLRLGWVVAPVAIVEHLATVRARTDSSGAAHSQHVTRELLATGLLDRHVATLRDEHRVRHRAMADALARHLPPGAATWRPADGGLYLWLQLAAGGPTAGAVQHAAAAAGVLVVAGPPFHPDGGGGHRLRLCFSSTPVAGIDEGVRRLAAAFRRAAAEDTDAPGQPLV